MEKNSSIPIECTILLFSTDPYVIPLNVIKTVVFILYFAWIIFAIKEKEFHNKNMAYLYNLNIVGILFTLYGFMHFFSSPCVPESSKCFFQANMVTFINYLPCFSLIGLAYHRLACFYIMNLKLSWRFIILTIGFIWIFSLTFLCIQLYGFSTQFYYLVAVYSCVIDSSKSIYGFYFALFGLFLLPNALIIFAIVVTMKKVRSLSSNLGKQKTQRHPIRLTIQFIAYLMFFELNQIVTLIIFYQSGYFVQFVSDETIKLLRIFKWFHHFSPLGLLYTHPVLIKKYERLWAYFK